MKGPADVKEPTFAVWNVASVGASVVELGRPSRVGDACRDWNGVNAGDGELAARGVKVKRKRRGSSCQKLRRLTNILDQLLESLVSIGCRPTEESSVAIKPIRSSFWSKLRPLKMPSRLMLMRHSPFGRPLVGVKLEAAVSKCRSGSGSWKYHHMVAHSIMAIWRVGDVTGLKSLEGGLTIYEM